MFVSFIVHVYAIAIINVLTYIVNFTNRTRKQYVERCNGILYGAHGVKPILWVQVGK